MATKVVHTIREDKQGLQKQLGCTNGLLQLFDRRYLLGLHRQGSIQKRLTAGTSVKEFKNASESTKVKKNNDRNQKKMTIEKNGASVDSSRNSLSSSSCSSTTFSSFDCSKRLTTEWQPPSELISPKLHKKQPDNWSLPPLDIRDVVKESMTRETRVTKQERTRPVMKHIDSPRPFVHQKTIRYDRKDQNLAKLHKSSSLVKEVSRFSCDERESQYSLKSTFKVKEPPRLSLDSKQNSHLKSMNGPRSEPGSNKRPSSGVVARLMGLDSLTDSVCEVDQLVSSSPRVQSKIRPALQQHEGGDRARKPSVYGEMEKMLNELKFNTSAKDLRALKQILEAIQMTKTGLKNKEQSLETHKPDPPCSPTVKGTSSPKRRELVNQTSKPAKMGAEPKLITGHRGVNCMTRKQVNDQTPKNMKAIDRTLSPKLHKSKNGVEKQCFNGPLSNSVRTKKQSNVKTKHPKIKTVNQMQNNDQPKKYHRNSFAERLIEDKPMVELTKLSVEQPSPDSVLDAFFIEDKPSPIKNKPNDNVHDDQTEWDRVGIYSLVNNTDEDHHSKFNHVKLKNGARLIQQTESLNSIDETNGDHVYIREILSASGVLNDLDFAIRIVQLYPTSTLIKPELFHLLENSNVEDDEKSTRSKSNETIRRKRIFDSVNEILFRKLVNMDGKLHGRFMHGEKLLKELWSEIDTLQNCSRRCIYDEDDDEVINIVSADLNTRSEDWGKYCYEVPSLVLDIERLIFKDLIDEVANAEMASLQDRPRRHCRQLFSM
ncbi:protein LONGIFOLIA 1-like isoform X2 [Bidens hawaiensis]|uniref:protein LONGIFOLIA 1-like isoform X2 n=1 Tax=Bidens hawaiensis TaxID=980011 RepID=UPI0040493C4F